MVRLEVARSNKYSMGQYDSNQNLSHNMFLDVDTEEPVPVVMCNIISSVHINSSLSQKSSTAIPKSFYHMAPLILFSLIVVLINLRVICIVTDVSQRRLKAINILVVHLSSVAIGFSFLLGAYILEKHGAITIIGQSACMVLAFMRNSLWALHPLNIVAVVYDRILTFRESIGQLLVKRAIFFIWIIATLESLPSIFMTKVEKDNSTNFGKCMQTPLMGSVALSVGYALMRFLFQHVLVVGYMCYALFQIRSKMKFLYIIKPIPTRRVRSAVRRLRFVYLYSIFFILVWLPTGFLAVAYSILGRTGKDYSVLQSYLLALIVLDYFFLGVSPVVVIYLNEDVSRNRWCRCRSTFEENDREMVQDKVAENECCDGDESKV